MNVYLRAETLLGSILFRYVVNMRMLKLDKTFFPFFMAQWQRSISAGKGGLKAVPDEVPSRISSLQSAVKSVVDLVLGPSSEEKEPPKDLPVSPYEDLKTPVLKQYDQLSPGIERVPKVDAPSQAAASSLPGSVGSLKGPESTFSDHVFKDAVRESAAPENGDAASELPYEDGKR